MSYNSALARRLSGDYHRSRTIGKDRWRVSHVTALGLDTWAVYRNGARMWSKPTLAEALDYIRRNS